jgi:hypothetical protein
MNLECKGIAGTSIVLILGKIPGQYRADPPEGATQFSEDPGFEQGLFLFQETKKN